MDYHDIVKLILQRDDQMWEEALETIRHKKIFDNKMLSMLRRTLKSGNYTNEERAMLINLRDKLEKKFNPNKKDTTITIRISAEDKARITSLAASRNQSIARCIIDCCLSSAYNNK